ncbi:SDR family oxidoreductase [Paucibacter sp. O1-1]|nr:SDR family oxidoreductase [Paucibacter sp. O1-1]MDA3825017.1 SDR family oxidoreductase [Paucibacter sp. O1-1]
MRIGISGASGKLGKAILSELQARGGEGHQVVAISRTPESVDGAFEARYGDYDNPQSLLAAYASLDRLVIIPSSDVRPGIRGTHFVSAIDAAVKAGVGHIVMISSAATREVAEPSMYAPYWTGEQHLFRAAQRWTILRMNYYAESFAQIAPMLFVAGVLPGLGEARIGYVSRDDLGAAAAGILLGEGHAGAIYSATGPSALSGPDRATLLSEAAGKPIKFVVVDEAQLRSELVQGGMPVEYIDALVDIEKSYVAGSFDIVTGDVERLAGRPPRSLRDVLSATLSGSGRTAR